MQKICEDEKTAQQRLGAQCAKKLFQRIGEIRASDNLAVLKILPAPRCHALSNNRDGQYAVDLVHPKRLILQPIFEGDALVEVLVTDIQINEIIDYH